MLLPKRGDPTSSGRVDRPTGDRHLANLFWVRSAYLPTLDIEGFEDTSTGGVASYVDRLAGERLP